MALPAIVRKFEIALADSDRQVYEQLSWRVAQHPSESERYLVARVLARALEHAEGLEFSKGGVSDDDEPALVQRDLRGDLVAWIEIGSPSPDRLHKASKAAPRVAVYTHKDPARLIEQLAGQRIHRADQIELWAIDRDLIAELVARRDRRTSFDLTVTERHLYVNIAGDSLEGTVVRHPLV